MLFPSTDINDMQYYFTRAAEKCPVFYSFAGTTKSPRVYRGQNGGFGDGKIGCYLPQVLQPFVLLFPQELHVPQLPPLHVPYTQRSFSV